MKKMLKYLGVVALAAGMFAACEHPNIDEIFDSGAMSQDEALIYMRTPMTSSYSWTYKAALNEDGYVFIGDVPEELTLVPVQISRPLAKDVNVTVTIDEEALEAYNAEIIANTESDQEPATYTLLEQAELLSSTLTIPAGEYISADSIKIRYKASEFFNGNVRYMVPIKVTADDAKSSTSSKIMVKYNATYQPIYISVASTSATYSLMFSVDDDSMVNGTGEISLGNLVVASDDALENTTVTLRINNDLVADYDPQAQTVSGASLSTTSATIKAGERASQEISVRISDNMRSMKLGTNYVIPVEITATQGHGTEVKTTTNVCYLSIKTRYEAVLEATDAAGFAGLTKFTPAGWTATGDGTGSTAVLFDGVTSGYSDYYYFTYLIVDLKEAKEIHGIACYAYYGYSSYLPNNYSVEVSNDNQSWSEVGDVTNGQAFGNPQRTIFLKPQTARYIKYNNLGNKYQADFVEFEVYGK